MLANLNSIDHNLWLFKITFTLMPDRTNSVSGKPHIANKRHDFINSVAQFYNKAIINCLSFLFTRKLTKLNIELESAKSEISMLDLNYKELDNLQSKLEPVIRILERKLMFAPRSELKQHPLTNEILKAMYLFMAFYQRVANLKELKKPLPNIEHPVFNTPCPFDPKDTFRRVDMYDTEPK